MTRDMSKSPYVYLLDNPDFRRWYENVERGSVATAHEWLRRMGFIHKRFNMLPAQLAKIGSKQVYKFTLDIVSQLQKEGKSGSYISNCIKPLKSWMEYNGKPIVGRIRITGRGEVTTVANEKTLTPEELGRVLNMADFRAKVACSLMAFGGFRPEVLGNYEGNDGLKLKDFPELRSHEGTIEFMKVPTQVIVRRTLSKSRKRWLTFICEEGCNYLKQYLEWRIRNGEALTPESPILTPSAAKLAGKHITSINISDIIRKPIRAAGFQSRPYVLRRYFDTRMMMAESDGLIIRDWREFWMGHEGDIEHTYTLNKGLTEDVVEKMREAYAKAADKYLVTGRKETTTKDEIMQLVYKQSLLMNGFSEEEVAALGDLSQKTAKEISDIANRKKMESLGLNGGSQKVVPMNEVKQLVENGWEYKLTLPDGQAVMGLPSR